MIDSKSLAGIQGLPLKAKFVAENVMHGIHTSRHLGANVEFVEHKEYAPGDDIRFIDWRAFARRDKYSIKKYEEDSNTRAYFWIDCSNSMAYQGMSSKIEFSKLDYAKILSSALAYLMVHQGDFVSMAGFSDVLHHFIPPKTGQGHLTQVFQAMEGLQSKGKTSFERIVKQTLPNLTRRSIIFIFSDLFMQDNSWMDWVRILKKKQHDVIIFHILDRWEVDFPFHESLCFSDLESENRCNVNAKHVRENYLQEIGQFLDNVRSKMLGSQIEYLKCITDLPPDELLIRFLRERGNISRKL